MIARAVTLVLLVLSLAACGSPMADERRAHDDAVGTASGLKDLLVLRFGDDRDASTMLSDVRQWLEDPPVEDHRSLGFPTIEVLGHDADSVEAVLYVFSEPKNLTAGEDRYGRTCQRYTVVDGALAAEEIDCPAGTPKEPVSGTDD